MIWSQDKKAGYDHKYMVSGVFTDWQERSQSFEQLVRWQYGSVDLTEADHLEQVLSYNVSANFFDTLGVRAALGRTFQPGEDQPGNERVVVLLGFQSSLFAITDNPFGEIKKHPIGMVSVLG